MVDSNSVGSSQHSSYPSGLYSGWKGRQGHERVDGPQIAFDANLTPSDAAMLRNAEFLLPENKKPAKQCFAALPAGLSVTPLFAKSNY